MNKVQVLLIMIVAFLFSSCNDDRKHFVPPTRLYFTIDVQPLGGSKINSVSASFIGNINTTETVKATIEWWWKSKIYDEPTTYKILSTKVYDVNINNISFQTSYSVSTGNFLNGYYWAVIKWTDENGSNEDETTQAYCY